MKLNFLNSKKRGIGGVFLIECLVYIAVFAIIFGVGTAAFYLLWDKSEAIRYMTDDISGALRAGEQWRADVRSATGKIEIENLSKGELLKIPRGKNEIFYRFSGDALWRKTSTSNSWTPVLSRVKTSQMASGSRHEIKAWRWELELVPRRTRSKLPLQFTFEAVAPAKS
ncbi:MAG: hypothetical protein ACREFE_16330 [Limisphaerales bacterium]